jgi:hypothetical protein
MLERLRRSFGNVQTGATHVTLYTKPGCSLCLEAELAVLRVFGRAGVQFVDITQQRELEDRFVFRIPVLAVNERVLAEGRISYGDARRAKQRLKQSLHDQAGQA